MALRVLLYGILLGLGVLALAWIDYLRLVRSHAGDIALVLATGAALALGIWIGRRVLGAPPPPFDGNPQGVAALGISPRELTVLQALAEGRSNAEIAALLGVSPNTVKTHLARLFDKLGASRRTEAVARARAHGIIR